jgi:NAD(P)-dependent dehydrogenase (short-subunit alcohol dehydrogenase family)
MNFNLDLDGRRALVTGGTKGIAPPSCKRCIMLACAS